jgi:hypothetical protein
MLLRMVGELNTKIPPPATMDVCTSPSPPVTVKPSNTVDDVWPEAKVTTLHWLPARLLQKLLSEQGCPVASMVVTTGPAWEMTLTPGRIRMASG